MHDNTNVYLGELQTKQSIMKKLQEMLKNNPAKTLAKKTRRKQNLWNHQSITITY